MILGGAAVYRCDKGIALNAALAAEGKVNRPRATFFAAF
jgi:hypothetical protein